MNWSVAKGVMFGLCLTGLILFGSGCLVVSHKSVTLGSKGPMVSAKTLEQIEPGKTSKAKVIALLGEPNSKQELDDGTELYKYVYTKQTKTNAVVFLLLTSHDTVDERSELFARWIYGAVFFGWYSAANDIITNLGKFMPVITVISFFISFIIAVFDYFVYERKQKHERMES